jgi:hypothetical protein
MAQWCASKGKIMSWILIITLVYNGVGIHHVVFNTEAECNTAGKIWEAKQKVGATNFICTPMKSP